MVEYQTKTHNFAAIKENRIKYRKTVKEIIKKIKNFSKKLKIFLKNMPTPVFVTEDIIDAALEELEADERNYEAAVTEFSRKQPALFNYLFTEDAELLTEDERELMTFSALVIYKSVETAYEKALPKITEKQISEAEESNWEKLEHITERRFRERIDIFFDSTDQEDLLAFAEDMLSVDEDSPVTKEGREPIFVALKTIVDVLT